MRWESCLSPTSILSLPLSAQPSSLLFPSILYLARRKLWENSIGFMGMGCPRRPGSLQTASTTSGMKHAFTTGSVIKISIQWNQVITISDLHETWQVKALVHELSLFRISISKTVIFTFFSPKNSFLSQPFFFPPNLHCFWNKNNFHSDQISLASTQRFDFYINPRQWMKRSAKLKRL